MSESLFNFNSHTLRINSVLRVFTEITVYFENYVKQKAFLFAGSHVFLGEFLALLKHEKNRAMRNRGVCSFQVSPEVQKLVII